MSLLLFFCTLFAADPAVIPEVPSAPVIMENYGGAFLRMFLTLIGLLVAIFFAVWLLKKLARGPFSRMSRNNSISIIERKPLSQKTMLYLIEVDGKQLLIAESHLEIKKLTTLDLLDPADQGISD